MADSITNKTVAVGTSQVQICMEVLPTQRKFIVVINTSTAGQKITLAVNQDAVAGAGIVLSPGGSYSDSADGNNYFPPHFSIQAISDAVSGSVSILERIGKEQ